MGATLTTAADQTGMLSKSSIPCRLLQSAAWDGLMAKASQTPPGLLYPIE